MDLQELLDSLESEEAKTTITELLEAETTKGKKKYATKDKEALKYKHALKDLGYDGASEGGLDGFISALQEKANATQPTGKEEELSAKAVQTELKQLKAKLEKAESDSKKSTITTELLANIEKDFAGSKNIIKNLIYENKVDLVNGKVVFIDGDDVTDMASGIEALQKTEVDSYMVKQRVGTETVDNEKDVETAEDVDAEYEKMRKRMLRQ